MAYRVYVSQEYVTLVHALFDEKPLLMKTAFLLSDLKKSKNESGIFISSMIYPQTNDFQMQTESYVSFYYSTLSRALKAAYLMDKNLAFIYSHPAGIPCWNNADEEMLFRITYAYMPLGTHISLCYDENKISGKMWLPNLRTEPLEVVLN